MPRDVDAHASLDSVLAGQAAATDLVVGTEEEAPAAQGGYPAGEEPLAGARARPVSPTSALLSRAAPETTAARAAMRAWEAAAESAESASAEPPPVETGVAAEAVQGRYPAREAALPSFARPALKPMPAMSDAAVQQVVEQP